MVFDAAGRVVQRLADSIREPGDHALAWDGRDDAGRILPSGAYFYHLETGGAAETAKLLLVK